MADKLSRHGNDLDLGVTQPVAPPGAPGRSTLTSKLFRRPIINVYRSAERDDNGVATGAEEHVERAAGSSGSALPPDLRERFEGSLGADLSGVRIHTGAASETAASAVGAKAYTVGNDIHFGAGHYDPSSSDGQLLIAHEVAHTVQQAGSTPTRQNKLEVSTPEDSAEADADLAAEAMVNGHPAAIAPGGARVQRQLADGSAPKDSVDAAAKAVDAAENAGEDAVNRFQEWMISEMTEYITRTASSPKESWRPSDIRGVLAYGATKAVGAGGGAVAGAASGAIAGLPGMVAGAAIGVIADKLGSKLSTAIAGGKPVEKGKALAERSKAIRDAILPAIKQAFQDGEDSRAKFRDAASKARQMLRDDNAIMRVSDVADWAEAEKRHADSLKFPPGGLWVPMLDRWLGAHASTPSATDGTVDGTLFQQAATELHGGDRIPPSHFWRYRLRKDWDAMGLDGERAMSAPTAQESTQSSVEFTSARDPAAFASRWGGSKDSTRYKHLADGGAFRLLVSYTSFQKRDDTSDTYWYQDLKSCHYMLDFGDALPADPGEVHTDRDTFLPVDPDDRPHWGDGECQPPDGTTNMP